MDFSVMGRAERSMKPAKKITYEFTRDAGFLHQYYRLREDMFIGMCGGVRPQVKEDAFDAAGDVLVARRGLHCLAGGRLTICAPSRRQKLPVEQEGVDLCALLPDIILPQHSYAEFSCFAILPEFHTPETMLEITRSLIRYAIAEGIEYIFLTLPVAIAYDFSKTARLCGARSDIRGDVRMPASYEGPLLTLSVMDLTLLMPVSARMIEEKLIAD